MIWLLSLVFQVTSAYDKYRYASVTRLVDKIINTQLAVYLDVVKDRWGVCVWGGWKSNWGTIICHKILSALVWFMNVLVLRFL